MVSLASPAGAMRPPPTPLRRPTLAVKRDSSFLDTDDEASLSSSTKKLKVVFDPNVDVRIMEDWTEKSYDLVKEEVTQGIDRHVAPSTLKDDARYSDLVRALAQDGSSSDAMPSKLLKKYILAIDSRISSLGECGRLVAAVLELSWLGRDETFVVLFTKVLCDLVSAHAKYTPATMDRLVSQFSRLPASLGRLPEESPVSRAKMFARLHLAIKTLIRQIPSASTALMKSLKLEFPNDSAPTKSYLQYQKHLLRLAHQLPELKSEILSLIVQRLVHVDVQIQNDIEDLEDEAEEHLLRRTEPRGRIGAAEDSDDSDVESVSESEETMTEEEERLRELRLKVDKMDGSLDLLFDYYTPLVEDSTRPESNDAFQQLLSHFANFILPNRTRHAQFLLFHFSQTTPAHTDLFADRCLHLAIHEAGSATHRFSACAYLSSFVARGAHIPRESVQRIVNILCHYLDSMRQRYLPTCRGPDRRNYALYYAIAQALLYIFCFRWRDLAIGSTTPELDGEDFSEDDALAEGRDLVFMSGVKETIQANVYCRLNPLKVCSPAIVGEFAKIANHLRFMYVIPLLETNKRLRLGQTYSYYGNSGIVDIGRRETAWDRKTGEAHHRLEAYFPFDPYTLPKSKHWVASDYNEWKLPLGMKRDDDDDRDEYSESEDEDESDDGSVLEEDEELPVSAMIAA